MTQFILEGQPATFANSWWIYVVLIGLIVLMLVVPMFTNRKRAKEYNDMINGIHVGDTIRTVGGIIGRITKINEKDGYKTIIVETGAKGSKTTMELDMASVYAVINATKKVEEPAREEKPAEEKVEEKPAEEEKKDEPKAEAKPAKKAKKSSK